jgi:hypothetical protein
MSGELVVRMVNWRTNGGFKAERMAGRLIRRIVGMMEGRVYIGKAVGTEVDERGCLGSLAMWFQGRQRFSHLSGKPNRDL